MEKIVYGLVINLSCPGYTLLFTLFLLDMGTRNPERKEPVKIINRWIDDVRLMGQICFLKCLMCYSYVLHYVNMLTLDILMFMFCSYY